MVHGEAQIWPPGCLGVKGSETSQVGTIHIPFRQLKGKFGQWMMNIYLFMVLLASCHSQPWIATFVHYVL